MKEEQINILLIEDEDFDVRRVKNTINFYSNQIKILDIVSNGNSAIELLYDKKDEYHVVIMDYQIAGNLRGKELIEKIKSINPSLQIIVITKMTINITDFDFANELMQAGAYWYCTKYPGDIEEYIYQPTDFIISIINAYQKGKLERISNSSQKKLRKNINSLLDKKKIIGVSEQTEKLRSKIKKYSGTDANILITGPSGTGKELVAYNIHYNSNRKYENFVPINCGSIPQDLLESELFGYEKGAFTGAQNNKQGLFEIANGGTIFLDEIAELPLNAQVKLLRVIQEGEIEKIGRTKSIKVNVRIIAATNKELEEEVKKGKFREDLYYRLNVIPIEIQALNKRKEDIPVLIDYFFNVYCHDMGRDKPEITDSALNRLVNYSWPGNVRQLKNVLQRLLLECENVVAEEDVILALPGKNKEKIVSGITEEFNENTQILPLRIKEREFRKKYFQFVRNQSSSDADAPKKLGLAPPNYYRMSKELGLK